MDSIKKIRELLYRDPFCEMTKDNVSLEDMSELIIKLSKDLATLELCSENSPCTRVYMNLLKLEKVLKLMKIRMRNVRSECKIIVSDRRPGNPKGNVESLIRYRENKNKNK